MIQPFEMKQTRPMELHDGVVSTTTDVWDMLSASQNGDLNRVAGINAPLGYAARWGHPEMVALLLERGADINKAGAPWATPLAWARKKGHAEIVELLKQHGAS
jgi:ankyrin repeat protein